MMKPATPLTSTLRTIYAEDECVMILDQSALPHQVIMRRLATLDEAAYAIRTMQVRGAPLIGATAAYGVALAMKHDASDAILMQAITTLSATRPTAINLHWALERMRVCLAPLQPPARERAAWREAQAICTEDAAANHAIGEHGLLLIEVMAKEKQHPINLMTHCNAGWLATVAYGTALAPVYAAQAAGIAVHVFVSETRPRNQGLLTAWELRQAGIAHTLIADNAAGLLLQQGKVDLVIVGADRICVNGDCANKIGTYLKALAAHDNHVPFYVAAPGSTIDWQCAEGGKIPIEERAADEIRHITGINTAGTIESVTLTDEDCVAANPAFDVTPARLISAIITERGIALPSQLRSL